MTQWNSALSSRNLDLVFYNPLTHQRNQIPMNFSALRYVKGQPEIEFPTLHMKTDGGDSEGWRGITKPATHEF